MSDTLYSTEDSITLLDVYIFIQSEWKTIFTATVAGSAIGVATAFALPEIYLAKAAIEPARVLGNPVESINVLAEKMGSPTYYSAKTLKSCEVSEKPKPAEQLIATLKPLVAKQSAFVSVTYRGSSAIAATACLTSVLEDVNRNQREISLPQIEQARSRVKKDEEKLDLAEKFVASASKEKSSFNFSDAKFSASSLLIVTLQSKQAEITELKNSIQNAKISLENPQTKPASFSTPIYSPTDKTDPKRTLITGAGFVMGGFTGLLFVFVRRAYNRVQRSIQTIA